MSRLTIMRRLIGLVGPLWAVMAFAILAGIAGHLAAIAVPTVVCLNSCLLLGLLGTMLSL